MASTIEPCRFLFDFVAEPTAICPFLAFAGRLVYGTASGELCAVDASGKKTWRTRAVGIGQHVAAVLVFQGRVLTVGNRSREIARWALGAGPGEPFGRTDPACVQTRAEISGMCCFAGRLVVGTAAGNVLFLDADFKTVGEVHWIRPCSPKLHAKRGLCVITFENDVFVVADDLRVLNHVNLHPQPRWDEQPRNVAAAVSCGTAAVCFVDNQLHVFDMATVPWRSSHLSVVGDIACVREVVEGVFCTLAFIQQGPAEYLGSLTFWQRNRGPLKQRGAYCFTSHTPPKSLAVYVRSSPSHGRVRGAAVVMRATRDKDVVHVVSDTGVVVHVIYPPGTSHTQRVHDLLLVSGDLCAVWLTRELETSPEVYKATLWRT